MTSSKGLIVSLVLHVAILAAALGAFWQEAPLPPAPKTVSVSIATPSELSQLKAGEKTAKEDDSAAQQAAAETSKDDIVTKAPEREKAVKPKAEPPKKQAALPPPEAPKAPPAEAKPDIEAPRAVPVPVRASRPAPRESREPAASQPEPRERPRKDDRIEKLLARPSARPEKNQDFDPDKIAALLNRDPTADNRPAANDEPVKPWRQPRSLDEQALAAPEDDLRERRVAYGEPQGRDTSMSANEIDAFRSQVSRCWTPPVGGLGSDRIIVKLRIALNQDGSLAFPPEVSNRDSSPFFRSAAESAMRAVMQCQPYQMPPSKYDAWRDMLLTFDPRQMYGG